MSAETCRVRTCSNMGKEHPLQGAMLYRDGRYCWATKISSKGERIQVFANEMHSVREAKEWMNNPYTRTF